tara:strand:+ start:222 stop:722 length:501 start_codon:yes stop_codon:yes gene_type:complete
MRIAESRLRKIIRNVIQEVSDYELNKDYDGEGLIPSEKDAEVGVSITGREVEKIKNKYGLEYIHDATSEDAKELSNTLEKFSRAEKINVLDPNDMSSIRKAHDNSPEDLLPLFVVKGAGNSKDYIVFKTVGSPHTYYIRSYGRYGLTRSTANKIIQPFDNTDAFRL